jgi:MSHA biogenesis protein MshM
MIRSHFGLEQNPFDPNKTTLLSRQKEIFDTLLVHTRQGGLCILIGEPGTGKSIIKEALQRHDQKKLITPTIGRTLHTYTNTLRILCEAFRIEPGGSAPQQEKRLLEAAWSINSKGRLLAPIIDDAHLMDIDCLRKLRLLFDDFPKNHNLILIGQPQIMQYLRLAPNEDIRSRITYSVQLKPLSPDDTRAFILDQLDHVRLAHNVFTDDALELIVRTAEGNLRRTRNLCISSLIETVRDRKQHADLDQINAVLMQPHWRKDRNLNA